MTDIDRPPVVLVGVDGSEGGDAALRWAENYVLATGARLSLVTSWHWPMSYGAPVYWDGWHPREDAQQVAEKAAASLRLPAERVTTLIEEGAAAEVLVRRSGEADLLVVGCRGHGGFFGAMLGSVSAHCAHHAQCPVVIVR